MGGSRPLVTPSPPKKEGAPTGGGDDFMTAHVRQQQRAERAESPARAPLPANTDPTADFMLQHVRSVPRTNRVDERARTREVNAPGLSTDSLQFVRVRETPKADRSPARGRKGYLGSGGPSPKVPADDFLANANKEIVAQAKAQAKGDFSYKGDAPKTGASDFMVQHVKAQTTNKQARPIRGETARTCGLDPPKLSTDDFMNKHVKSAPHTGWTPYVRRASKLLRRASKLLRSSPGLLRA